MTKTNKGAIPNTQQDTVNQTNQNKKGVNVMNNYTLTGLLANKLNQLNYKEKGNIDKFDYQDPIHHEIVDIIRQTTNKEDLLILEQAERIYRQMANRFTKANRTQRAYVQQRIDNNKDLIKEVLKADKQQQSLFETKVEQAKQEQRKDLVEPTDIQSIDVVQPVKRKRTTKTK
jgi:hypothetical protein